MEAERTILAFETKTRAQEGSKGCYQSLPRFLPPKGFAGQREGLLSTAQEPERVLPAAAPSLASRGRRITTLSL